MKKIIGSIVVYHPKMDKLKKTIETFLDAYDNSEVYIWDNSCLDTLQAQLLSLYPLRVIYKKSSGNIGYGRGNNGVFESLSQPFDYFCILNPDLEIPSHSIKSLVQFMESHPQYGLVSGAIKGPDGAPHDVHKLLPSFFDYIMTLAKRFLKIKTTEEPLYKNLPKTPFSLPIMSGCFMFFTKDHYKELNGFDDRFFLYFEDYDLSLRSFLAEKSVIIPTIPIVHGWARDSHKNTKLFFIQAKSGFQFYAKWGFLSFFPRKVNSAKSIPKF